MGLGLVEKLRGTHLRTVPWGEEAAYLLRDPFPLLGSLLEAPGGTGLQSSGLPWERASELPLPENTLRLEPAGGEAVGVYGNFLQVTSKVAQGGIGRSGTSATGLCTCCFISCSQ